LFGVGHPHRRAVVVGDQRAVGVPLQQTDVDAGQWPAHRSWTNRLRSVIRDHDAARLGLPPGVDHRNPERPLAPLHRIGIERFADAGDEPQV